MKCVCEYELHHRTAWCPKCFFTELDRATFRIERLTDRLETLELAVSGLLDKTFDRA